MGATATESALSDFFIRKYNLANREAEWKKNRPTLQMVTQNKERLKGGDAFYVTVRISDGWSDSPGFAQGMANYNVGTTKRWLVGDPYAQYGRLTFDGLMLARNNVGTLIDLKSVEADGVSDNMLNSLEFQMWNDGTGKRAQVTALGGTATTRVFTLESVDAVYNVVIGMILQFNTNADGSGTTRADTFTVTALDPLNSQITATRNGSAADVAANDYAFSIGSVATGYCPGIPSFIPAADPSDTLFGVTRTGLGPALSGWRFPFQGSIAETIQRAFSRMGKFVNRAAARYMVCLSMTDWLLLSFEREGRIVEDQESAKQFGLTGLRVLTALGPVTCVAIPQMVDGRGYIIDWSTWTLYTLGNLPHVIDDDGKVFQRLAPGSASDVFNGDGIEMRLRLWKVLLCDQPISNATFPTK